MRYIITLLLLGPAIGAAAQPALEHANVDLIGKSFAIHVVTDPGTSDPSPDGANVTWDFSSATLQMNAGTCEFVDPATTPDGSSYPAANVAQVITSIAGTTYTYLALSSSLLEMLAEGIGGVDEIDYTDPKTVLEFPYAYTNSFTDDFAYGGNNYSVTRTYSGYGTVILPTGTYTDVVKMTSTSGSIDFFRSNPVEPLVTIDDDGLILVWGDATSGIAALNEVPALTVTPNPADDAVVVRGIHTAGTWQLLDAQGRVQRDGRHIPGILSLDLTGLSPGGYSLVVKDASGVRTTSLVKE